MLSVVRPSVSTINRSWSCSTSEEGLIADVCVTDSWGELLSSIAGTLELKVVDFTILGSNLKPFNLEQICRCIDSLCMNGIHRT